MAITDKEKGVWELDQVYNKINQGDIWEYDAVDPYRLFAWGYFADWAGGTNDRINRSSPTQIGTATSWGTIEKGIPYTNFLGGSEMSPTLALKQDGTLWWWGENKSGASGTSLAPSTRRSAPTQVGTDTTWRNITQSKGTLLATKTDGTLWTWGRNNEGELGNRATADRSSPIQVGTDTTWTTGFASDSYAMFAVKTDGTLWSWGDNERGILAHNNHTQYSSPTQVGTDTTWTTGGSCTANNVARFIKSDGTLWTWGGNSQGCLGLNQGDSVQPRSSPTQVGTDTTWKSSYGTAVNGNAQMGLAVKTDGTLWSWGYNRGGTLGQNTEGAAIPASSPMQIGTDTNWDTCKIVIAGGCLATKTDGTAWAWGINYAGQLGLNQSGNPYANYDAAPKYSSPTQIPGTDWGVITGNYSRQTFGIKVGT